MNAAAEGSARPLRVLYCGMGGELSRAPLAALLQAGIPVCAVLVTGTCPASAEPYELLPPPQAAQHTLPLLNPFVEQGCIQLAWTRAIPVYRLHRVGATATQALIAALAPTVAIVSCFDRRIPSRLLKLPAHGFLNLHPSLLPAFRGPAPLFWTLRAGIDATGVTVHFMDEELDRGDIARQAPLVLPEGASTAQIEALCAQLGGELLVATVEALAAGTQERRPQPAGGSYQPQPQPQDFQLERSWSARRAYNFICGTAAWGVPYPVRVGERLLPLARALSFSAAESSDPPVQVLGNRALVRFSPGTLEALLA